MEKFNHGNRLRPKDEAYEVKKARSRRVYAELQMKLNPWWLNEKLLREQYHLYGNNYEEDPMVLYNKGFRPKTYTSESVIDGETVFIMNKYGYSITKTKKIKAWKI